ncbi:hypothetical protein FGO68_gene4863 [Halteria grandinella]|uniref:Uncharacterized protein n=1 Tax=Halteria grandinella TaxID=5974 RepID=A0A8J8T2Z0_HALGN|nr:hypothetical protein FGO68_gene4863 [Halteria grandinella]
MQKTSFFSVSMVSVPVSKASGGAYYTVLLLSVEARLSMIAKPQSIRPKRAFLEFCSRMTRFSGLISLWHIPFVFLKSVLAAFTMSTQRLYLMMSLQDAMRIGHFKFLTLLMKSRSVPFLCPGMTIQWYLERIVPFPRGKFGQPQQDGTMYNAFTRRSSPLGISWLLANSQASLSAMLMSIILIATIVLVTVSKASTTLKPSRSFIG